MNSTDFYFYFGRCPVSFLGTDCPQTNALLRATFLRGGVAVLIGHFDDNVHLPVESLHWIPLNGALEDVAAHFSSNFSRRRSDLGRDTQIFDAQLMANICIEGNLA